MTARQMPSFVPDRGSFVRCKRCHEQFFFVETVKNKRMPVDVAPASDGNLIIHKRGPDEEGNPRLPFGSVVSGLQAEGMREAGIRLYVSHFRDCPYAEEFRKKARSRGTWRRNR
ncbi:hypothetical protein HH308_06485 [Gordonia sp. TBRC 11910]|uniref:Uncharacterized protein n=1 Tax=Gordonia asplenii TaxID=2725283 RepID=A0A848KRX9_9ACTN|nr:hypothetical protein [Gordonia asplenii]NMO00859.1 hypothetical protein [Gordonia asplenii]